jgi:hypothetical protein
MFNGNFGLHGTVLAKMACEDDVHAYQAPETRVLRSLLHRLPLQNFC